MITTWSLQGDLNIIMILTLGRLLSPLEHLCFPSSKCCAPFAFCCLFVSFSRSFRKTDGTRYFSLIFFHHLSLHFFFIRMHSKDCHKQTTMGSLVSKDCKQFHQLHKTSLTIHEAPLHCWMRNWFNGPCHCRMLQRALSSLMKVDQMKAYWREFFCGIVARCKEMCRRVISQ